MTEDKPNQFRTFATTTLLQSLGRWERNERDKVTDAKGYGTDDRRTFQYRADLLDAVIHRLAVLESAIPRAS